MLPHGPDHFLDPAAGLLDQFTEAAGPLDGAAEV
jgi:hypothetical protein